MRFFVTGVGGQLGHDVLNELDKRGYEAVGTYILDEVNNSFPYVKLVLLLHIRITAFHQFW